MSFVSNINKINNDKPNYEQQIKIQLTQDNKCIIEGFNDSPNKTNRNTSNNTSTLLKDNSDLLSFSKSSIQSSYNTPGNIVNQANINKNEVKYNKNTNNRSNDNSLNSNDISLNLNIDKCNLNTLFIKDFSNEGGFLTNKPMQNICNSNNDNINHNYDKNKNHIYTIKKIANNNNIENKENTNQLSNCTDYSSFNNSTIEASSRGKKGVIKLKNKKLQNTNNKITANVNNKKIINYLCLATNSNNKGEEINQNQKPKLHTKEVIINSRIKSTSISPTNNRKIKFEEKIKSRENSLKNNKLDILLIKKIIDLSRMKKDNSKPCSPKMNLLKGKVSPTNKHSIRLSENLKSLSIKKINDKSKEKPKSKGSLSPSDKKIIGKNKTKNNNDTKSNKIQINKKKRKARISPEIFSKYLENLYKERQLKSKLLVLSDQKKNDTSICNKSIYNKKDKERSDKSSRISTVTNIKVTRINTSETTNNINNTTSNKSNNIKNNNGNQNKRKNRPMNSKLTNYTKNKNNCMNKKLIRIQKKKQNDINNPLSCIKNEFLYPNKGNNITSKVNYINTMTHEKNQSLNIYNCQKFNNLTLNNSNNYLSVNEPYSDYKEGEKEYIYNNFNTNGFSINKKPLKVIQNFSNYRKKSSFGANSVNDFSLNCFLRNNAGYY